MAINSPIKKPGEIENISEEEMRFRVNEIKRCIDDPIYFCKNYYYIRSIDKGTIIIPLYEKQEELISSILNNRFSICLAARQSGKTTAYAAVVLWVCFFMAGKEIVIVANKEQTAIGILKRIKSAYEWIPDNKSWIKPCVKKWSEKQIEFENGCIITAMASSADAARSTSCLSGDTTICMKIGSKCYKKLKIRDASRIINKTKENCPCDDFNGNLSKAIKICEDAHENVMQNN